jgi:hypothetical protein
MGNQQTQLPDPYDNHSKECLDWQLPPRFPMRQIRSTQEEHLLLGRVNVALSAAPHLAWIVLKLAAVAAL